MASSVEVATRRRKALQPQAAKLADVAARCGVSLATASRALTRPELVSESIRIQVEATAAAMAYRPNAAAQSLSSATAHLVGAVLADPFDRTTWRAFVSFEQSLSAGGVGVAVAIAGASDAFADGARRVERCGARSIAIFGSLDGRTTAAPWILVDSGRLAGSVLALRYLFQLGHRRVALQLDPALQENAVGDRCSDLDGLQLDVILCAGLDPGEDAARLLRAWRASPSRATALLCQSDDVAEHALHLCRDAGVEVPVELSLIGFGDSEWARCSTPGLTTVRVAAEQAGAESAAAMMTGGKGARRVHVPAVRLVLRGSCAPPA